MADIELYSFAACPFAQRSRMVLAEKCLEFELHEIDVYNKPAGWEQISPTGRVPLLRHNGGTIYESTIINEYIDEEFPQPPLMPPGSLARALARIWIDYCEKKFLPAVHDLMRYREDAHKLSTQIVTVHDVIEHIEFEGLRKISDGPFWFGASPTLVDFQYLPFFERFGVYEKLAGFVWPEQCTRLQSWLQAMSARDSVQPTMHPLEYHLEQQRRLSALIAARESAS